MDTEKTPGESSGKVPGRPAAGPPGEGSREFHRGDIQGVVVRELGVHRDRRGWLAETYRLDTLPGGITPVMSYVSFTEPLTARGPHEHREQTDLFAFTGPGTFLLMLWDNREHSPTRGAVMELQAGEERPLLVAVPPGVVHGYRNLSREVKGMVLNFPDRLYRGWGKGEDVDEVRHEDSRDRFYRDFVRGWK
ncbi:MAG: dTDP-4-dehydrorhamnose 3,5-epimerase family protein [Spirochaetota bacterium]